MSPAPGERTTRSWHVGRKFRLWGKEDSPVGVCISVTPWGNDRIRWVRLRFEDGTERSYAPSHLFDITADEAAKAYRRVTGEWPK